jgi:hypothetical protein
MREHSGALVEYQDMRPAHICRRCRGALLRSIQVGEFEMVTRERVHGCRCICSWPLGWLTVSSIFTRATTMCTTGGARSQKNAFCAQLWSRPGPFGAGSNKRRCSCRARRPHSICLERSTVARLPPGTGLQEASIVVVKRAS